MRARATGDRSADGGVTAPPICRRLFSTEQAADFAGVPVQEIWRQIRIGKLQAYHLGGGRVRIDEADLIAKIPPRELEW